jgi:hypothetical protein
MKYVDKAVYNKLLKHRNLLMVLIIIIGVSAGAVLQAGYGVTTIWDADVELKGIGIGTEYWEYDSIVDYETKSYTKITADLDGDPDIPNLSSMQSAGLLPEYDWTLGSLFYTDQYGTSVDNAHPKKDETVNGIRYLTYYFGFSASIISRTDHDDIIAEDHVILFDYYGVTLNDLYEVPEFATGNVVVDVGVRLANIDDTIPTECGVQQVKLLNTRMRYTQAAAMGESDDIEDFNHYYDWIDTYNHKGSISVPIIDHEYYGMGYDYSSVTNVQTTLSPGSEYAITYGDMGGWYGGSFNVFDVEIIMDFMIEVRLTYELAADIGNYLAGRLDISGTEDPIDISFFAAFLAMLNDLLLALGLNLGDPFTLIMLIIGALIVVFVLYKILRKGVSIHPAGRMLGY